MELWGAFLSCQTKIGSAWSAARLPVSATGRWHTSQDWSSSLRPVGGGNRAPGQLTWGLVLLEGVADEGEEKHDGSVRLLGVLHQVAFLEVAVPLLFDVIFGEGDVLHRAVLTGLFHWLGYHRRTCVSIRGGGGR